MDLFAAILKSYQTAIGKQSSAWQYHLTNTAEFHAEREKTEGHVEWEDSEMFNRDKRRHNQTSSNDEPAAKKQRK